MAQIFGLKRIPGQKLIIDRSNNSRVWFCDGCGAAFQWDFNSMYYGSENDTENQNWKDVWIACSQACAGKMPAGFPEKKKRKPKDLNHG